MLVDSNKTPYLREFEPTVTWVKSIYRRCNFTRRAGTTTRPPVPRECLKNVNLHFLLTLKRRGFKFPRGIAISQDPKHYCNEDETLTLIDKLIAPMSRGKERSSNCDCDCVGARQRDPLLSASESHRQSGGQEI